MGSMSPIGRAALAALVVILLDEGCLTQPGALAAEPGVTFAAHLIHAGMMVDHMQGGEPARLQPLRWFHWPGDPDLVMRDGGSGYEGLWLRETGRVYVRSGTTQDAPVVARVEPDWDDNAIRLTLWPTTGPPIHSTVFERLDFGAGPDPLSRIAQTDAEVRGTYQAVLRAPDGTEVGWLRVQIGLHQPAFEMFEGALPASVDEGLAAAAAVALGSEIDWILGHVTQVSGPDWGT